MDELPVPSPRLIQLVAGTPRLSWYTQSGARAAECIRQAYERNGLDLESTQAILDFGCGCGRVLRHWRTLPAAVHGSDMNPRLVHWCRRNLSFASFEVNAAGPPLPYSEGAFDLVYALSVFTHLPEPLQRPWIDELRRVTRPGGHVLLTIHGDRYRADLTAEEQAQFDAGELVVRGAEVAGSNHCGAYHPAEYLRRLTGSFELVEHVPEGATGNPDQDLILLRRA